MNLTRDNNILSYFKRVRSKTLNLVMKLNHEDMVVQSEDFVSPIKWHLGHTTWFFETFILKKFNKKYKTFDKSFNYIFNSYYNKIGLYNPKSKRGLLVRPTTKKIFEYREFVNNEILNLLIKNVDNNKVLNLIELGINHEQQHQELILMDILNIFYNCPFQPPYKKRQKIRDIKRSKFTWSNKEKINYKYGYIDDEFSYDNEGPSGEMELNPFQINIDFVTVGDWQNFIEDGGYSIPDLWLSDGWDFIKQNEISMPMYWIDENHHFTLYGVEKLKKSQPVSNISFYEAYAYCKYKKQRLPTEFELEHFLKSNKKRGNLLESNNFQPISFSNKDYLNNAYGNLWCWTSSYYQPYKKFKPFKEDLGEYNEKFMCNQFVLKGGSFATPINHIRPSYRNFYYPHDRWQFCGLRLVKDI